jgi:pyruvate dehydrogenase E1 component alpha subunit
MTLPDLPIPALGGDHTPLRFFDEHGEPAEGGLRPDPRLLKPEPLLAAYRALRRARAFDTEATNLVMQGHLAVYPSSRGQEACQAAAALALRSEDWLFPTYRDTAALAVRGIDPAEALTLLRGSWHCGYDAKRWRTAPQSGSRPSWPATRLSRCACWATERPARVTSTRPATAPRCIRPRRSS